MRVLANILMLIFLCISCVGEVENKDPDTTKGLGDTKSNIAFDGIYKAIAISSDKAEIYFYPSTLLASQVTYVVTYDGLATPFTFAGHLLRPDYRGLLSVTIENLVADTSYDFSVQIKDQFENISNSNKTERITTFSNVTAEFYGISSVSNLAGSDGRNAITVGWPAAKRDGTILVKMEKDPVNYEITLLDSSRATPSVFDDPTFVEPVRKVVLTSGEKITERINGLQPGTRYYVRVRAIHHGYNQNISNESYKREQNNRYLTISTLGGGSGDIKYDKESLVIKPLTGASGKSAFNINWGVVTGAFDHYRLYYKESDEPENFTSFFPTRNATCNGAESGDFSCLKIGYDKFSLILADLKSFTDYDFHLVICPDVSCTGVGVSLFESKNPYKTMPQILSFDGIISIDKAKYYWALDELYLNISGVQIDKGYLDGLIVQLKQREEGPSQLANINLNDPSGTVHSIYTIPFDYLTDRIITVKGVDGGSPYKYCFSVFPYYIDNGTVVEMDQNAKEVCQYPDIELPTVSDFDGPFDAQVIGLNMVNVSWRRPVNGVYDKFLVVVKMDGTPFSLTEAITYDESNPGQTQYVLKYVDYSALSSSVNGLSSGSYYVGVWAYMSDNDKFSNNTDLIRVTVP